MMDLELRELCFTLSDALAYAPRHGADEDNPEGVRYIQLSDTLAKDVTAKLHAALARHEVEKLAAMEER